MVVKSFLISWPWSNGVLKYWRVEKKASIRWSLLQHSITPVLQNLYNLNYRNGLPSFRL